ncbi:MAG: methyltransferase domain-containing protein [Scytolyngbya sp. HA4215-MV1]|jgi:ubiquinone/menaquinone biosynthesis C-methylase UbiE|nr:methyltransferase domain-containing protein [Scytolyngbya sp. HA4215-MV1]
MDPQASDLLENIRQQFDTLPYPHFPLDATPKDIPGQLYLHSLTNPFYFRDRRIIDPTGRLILDAGCGSGYKSLSLAIANPGAQIVGVDLSDESIKFARQRLQYHGFEQVKFHTCLLEHLPSLNLQFDYINCDEVLYLLPDPIAGLRAMKAVLKPDGIIRVNFHSLFQRAVYLRGQEFFAHLTESHLPTQAERIEQVRVVMRSLKAEVFLKNATWKPIYETDDARVLTNYLLQGDKGWTIPQFFSALQETELAFIGMVDWRQWDLTQLFESVDDLPIEVVMHLSETSIADQLHLYELIHPVHRLLDLWCGHPTPPSPAPHPATWSTAAWQRAIVHFHPQLVTPTFQEALFAAAMQLTSFDFNSHLRLSETPVTVEGSIAAWLLPLSQSPQALPALLHHWLQLKPIDPITLEPTLQQTALSAVQSWLLRLESAGYVLLELRDS